MKQNAKTLAQQYSDSFEKMNFNQLKFYLEMNEITYDEFLKELDAVEWKKTGEVFKFWGMMCLLVVVCRFALLGLLG